MAARKVTRSVAVAGARPVPASGPRHFIAPSIEPGFVFGPLRREFGGATNNLVEFGWAKLHPMHPKANPLKPDRRVWAPTASRVDVLLPADAADPMQDPRRLLEAFEDQEFPDQKDLAVHVKLVFPDAVRLHSAWEKAREFARTVFLDEHKLAVIMALHIPALSPAKVPGPPHIHILALARVLGPRGFGAFCTIACDEGHEPLVTAWRRVRDR